MGLRDLKTLAASRRVETEPAERCGVSTLKVESHPHSSLSVSHSDFKTV